MNCPNLYFQSISSLSNVIEDRVNGNKKNNKETEIQYSDDKLGIKYKFGSSASIHNIIQSLFTENLQCFGHFLQKKRANFRDFCGP